MDDRVSDVVLAEHIENAEAWLDTCECKWEHDHWEDLDEEERAEATGPPVYCIDCLWWRQSLAILYEAKARRSQRCETCKYADDCDDMLPSHYLWCKAYEAGFQEKHYCGTWEAKESTDGME